MEKLKKLIREYDLPPKPVPKVDIDLYNDMVKLYKAITKEKDAARKLDQKIHALKEKLSQTTGIFKGGERKRLNDQIARTAAARDKHEKAIDSKVRKAGYPDTQTFLRTLEKARPLAEQYAREVKAWKEEVAAIKEGKQPHRKLPKPEKQSIRKQLARYQEEVKQQPQRIRSPLRASRGIEL